MELDFADLLKMLRDAGVEFIVVGGIACALNGFVRATEDVDILVRPDAANVRELLNCLSKWGQGYANELSPADFTLVPGAVRVVEDYPLDMFTVLAGRTHDDFLPHTRTTEHGIRFLDPQALIETKQGTHREKDAIDILALRRILADEPRGERSE
ncbi:MAG: hypothetical protein GXP31_15940 [Kiritimatiellaeota bacterium]|nr:hypothetical protein [Kiritimatiellota bacterium]